MVFIFALINLKYFQFNDSKDIATILSANCLNILRWPSLREIPIEIFERNNNNNNKISEFQLNSLVTILQIYKFSIYF